MGFNKHYLEDVLKRMYGFVVERDATGMAFNAFLEQGKEVIHLSGPWGDREAARQTGVVELIKRIRSRKVRSIRCTSPQRDSTN